MSMIDTLDAFILDVNDVFWTYLLIPLVAVAGLWFTFRSKAVQLRLVPEMFRVFRDRPANGGVSPFGAFTISAAARIGTGNIAGVATAITLGGAGAVFWMWVMAIVGGASAFVESTLAQLYKSRGKEPGTFRGGPAYYMQRALGKRWLGVLFAVLITLTFGFVLTAVQSNTITVAAGGSFGDTGTTFKWVLGGALAVMLALAVFYGVKRIARVTQVLIPTMVGLYLLLGTVIVLLNISSVPGMLADIVAGAFGFREVAGGAVGTAILQGVRRGMFSNEAGMGSGPNAAAAAETSHPVKQGLVQTLGVYVDTIVVCTMTALIILSANPTLGERGGADVTQTAFSDALGGWAGHALTLVVFMVAFSSMIGNYYYGESNIEFITERRSVMNSYRAVVIGCVLLGALGKVSIVWNLADITMGAMVLVNLLAILPLSVIAFKLLDDYMAQRRQGLDPVFTRDRVPGLKNVECWEPAAEQEPAAAQAGREPARVRTAK
ncbi:alanine/glycine:cation symporter family protein [Streptomyces alkaliterrae]|uniref:alanine/glycine:cation symporter family protein n=1 Tax=Streptomyces alkaliterrae TaxID=2213162 RepID=UPI001E4AD7D1|nr:alanine/glycine:cation symporter family protein [Streptomyces alkaliterrae]